jgi:hypothetical protein
MMSPGPAERATAAVPAHDGTNGGAAPAPADDRASLAAWDGRLPLTALVMAAALSGCGPARAPRRAEQTR